MGTAACDSVRVADLILPQEPERRVSGLGELPRFGHGTGSVSANTSLNTTIIDGVMDEYYSEMVSAFMTPRKLSNDMYSRQREGEENEESKYEEEEQEGGDLIIMQDINNTILSIISTDDECSPDDGSVNPPQLNVNL